MLIHLLGAGYNLTIVKEGECDVSKITNLIQEHVPEGTLHSNIAAELNYILPNEQSQNFSSLFKMLEASQEDLKISSFGVSQTTMDEVFLR